MTCEESKVVGIATIKTKCKKKCKEGKKRVIANVKK